MKRQILISIFLLFYNLNFAQKNSDDLELDYLSFFIDKIDDIFSNITESETKKKLKRECIYLISDISELQIETEIILEAFVRDTLGNWLENADEYSNQLEIIYNKNNEIKERIRRIRIKYHDYFNNVNLDIIDEMGKVLLTRRAVVDHLQKFLLIERIQPNDNKKILNRLILLDAKAKRCYDISNEFRKKILEKY